MSPLSPSYLQLEWGNKQHIDRVCSNYGPFDMIVGSDLIYEPFLHAALADTVAALAPPGIEVILGFPTARATLEEEPEERTTKLTHKRESEDWDGGGDASDSYCSFGEALLERGFVLREAQEGVETRPGAPASLKDKAKAADCVIIECWVSPSV